MPDTLQQSDLADLIQSHTEIVSNTILRQMTADAATGPGEPITTGMGEYLVLTSRAWCHILDGLVESPRFRDAACAALEESRRRSHCADLSAVVSIDMEMSKLRRIFEKMKGFTQDVEAIWYEGSAGSGLSTVPREFPTPLLKEVDEQLKSQMKGYTSSPTKSDSTD